MKGDTAMTIKDEVAAIQAQANAIKAAREQFIALMAEYEKEDTTCQA